MAEHTGPHQVQMDGWIACAPFEQVLHLDVVEADEGWAKLTMPFLADFAQGAGLLHGGALVSLADTAVVMAIKSLVPPDTHFATVALEARFLRSVRQGIVTALARITRREGRTLLGEATVYDSAGQEVLAFSSTFKIVQQRRTE